MLSRGTYGAQCADGKSNKIVSEKKTTVTA